jgi:mRNA-degrading endonuclease RelE of RelBE toxin-antitoxin system
MNYEIVTTQDFEKAFKRLSKKYHSLIKDYAILYEELMANPTMGDKISDDVRKIRMAIASKGRGKSGGARIITCEILVEVSFTKIYLLTIYSKSEQASVAKDKIEKLKKANGLS